MFNNSSQAANLSAEFANELNPYVRDKYLELWHGVKDSRSGRSSHGRIERFDARKRPNSIRKRKGPCQLAWTAKGSRNTIC